MDAPPTPTTAGRRRPAVSRRTLVLGGGALAAAAAASSAAHWLSTRGPGLVDRLLASRPFTVAHRGSDLDWPEMTAYAYARSVAAGARALEIALGRTADGVWFGVHDRTLDRTSGTSGFVTAEHTWSEVRRLQVTAALTRFPAQPTRPYLRLEDFLHRFVPCAVAFVDPKGGTSQYYGELLAIVRREVPDPAGSIVAKSEATNVLWARAARAAGLRTWGFYYGRDLTADPTLLGRTAGEWDLLGLDWSATPVQWAQVTALKKPVIGHVVATEAQRAVALSRGAAGVIVSDLLRVAP